MYRQGKTVILKVNFNCLQLNLVNSNWFVRNISIYKYDNSVVDYKRGMQNL